MVHVYHPNKNVKGFACSFWYSKKHNHLFATLIKQSGWDENTQNGTFKGSLNDPTKKVSIKLSDFEAAAILDCIERNRPFTTFHDGEEFPKAISFVPWMNNSSGEAPATQRGYSFSISVNNKSDAANKNSFYIGLTFAEARYIREYIIYCLHASFAAESKVVIEGENESEAESPNSESSESSNNLVDF